MRKLFTLFAAVLFVSSAFGQAPTQRVVTSKVQESHHAIPEAVLMEPGKDLNAIGNNSVPIGTVTSSAVTAVKIGQASNAITVFVGTNNQVTHAPGVGTMGGALAFIYRQNIQECGGVTADNGKYRYSISLDGGQNWRVTNANDSSSTGNNFLGCYGKGPINPSYSRPSRYPNLTFFSLDASNNVDSLALAYSGPVLQPSASGWDGNVAGTVSGVAGSPTVIQEDYLAQGGNEYFSYTLLSQYYGGNWNFWYLSSGWNGTAQTGEIIIKKGVWNSTSRQITWSTQTTLNPNYNLNNIDGTYARGDMALAFDPSGQYGWVSFLGDLVGGNDSSFNVCFSQSTDGGASWGTPFEIDMRQFPELKDTLQAFWITIDTVYDMNGNIVSIDTLPATFGKPTTGFDLSLTVDATGTPHVITVVGNGNTRTTPDANYSIFSGLRLDIWDITKDSYGDWNMLHLWNQSTFRGVFTGITALDPFVQASRSPDGNVLLFSWTDSDTTGNFGLSDNNAPDLLARGYYLNTNKVTEVVNFTGNDLDWATKALYPHTSPLSVKNATVYTLPTVITNLDNNDGALPVSFWYFTDVNFDTDTDFTEDPVFFYNCKQNPFSNNVATTDASCASNNDGTATLNATGGVAPYVYEWDAAAGSAATPGVTGLAAGVYTVTVTDDKGCSDVQTVIINNIGAPTASVSAASVTDPLCFGQSTGAATVTTSGGSGGNTYLWNTSGETTAAATMLPAGTSVVTVTDMAGCASFAVVTLSQPPAINSAVTGTDVSCFGAANGAAAVSIVSGGAGGFTFLWDDAGMSTTQSISGLAGGIYNVTITDANGCDVSQAVTVNEPAELLVSTSTTPITTCMTTFDGTATAAATGGTAPYAYSWSNGASGSFIFSLDCGCYTVTVTDANNCVVESDTIKLGVTTCGGSSGLNDELSAGISAWEMYPNPNTGSFTMSLELANLADLRFEVINLNGKVVATRSMNNVLNYRENIDLGNLASGIYLVRLSTSQGTATRKLMIK